MSPVETSVVHGAQVSRANVVSRRTPSLRSMIKILVIVSAPPLNFLTLLRLNETS